MTTVDTSTLTLAERLVNRIATWRPGRRSVLAGSALVGSALAVDPWGFVTRPQSAYASVCGSGAACSDGWTVFCCTISGKNTCPPGSFVGGWWKADRSGFCAGAARYYIDCNASCGSGWSCHCNDTGCDRRRVACNQFRYGQCHQEISCYGPVVCRMITCTPPWELTGACTSASATDNRTASHSAECLPGPTASSITSLYQSLGSTGGTLGYPISLYLNYSSSVGYQRFRNGEIVASPGVGAKAVIGSHFAKWQQFGGYGGRLGVPTSTTGRYADGSGTSTRYHGGMTVDHVRYGVHGVWGSLFEAWVRLGGSGGVLGQLRSDTTEYTSGSGYYTNFEHGRVVALKGKPAFGVFGADFTKWQQLNSTSGVLGVPTSDTTTWSGGTYTSFVHGETTVSDRGPHAVWGPVYTAWVQRGGRSGRFGPPVSDVYDVPDGKRADFANGTLTYQLSTGRVSES